jgi:hypothetical protein
VRPGADWCSLCYQDLRSQSHLVTASSAPLVEASIEPGPVRWAELRAWHGGVEEADVSPDGDPNGSSAPPAEESDKTGSVQKNPAPDLRWPCACGARVAFDQDACPDCGSAFLGDLREGANALNGLNGRHRVGAAGGAFGAFAHQWSTSKTFRFVVAGAIALFVAVGLPVMLALLG